MKKCYLSALMVFVIVMISACGTNNNDTGETNESEVSEDGNTKLVVAQQADTSTLDPQKQGKMPDMNILINMFDTLVGIDEENNLAPSLALEWEPVGDSTWEFKLREGVTFHNGEEFNAETVKFSIDRLLDPETQSPIVELNNVDSVEVIDDYTVQIHTDGPDPILPNKLTLFGGVIVPKQYIEENGDDHFTEEPVGTGPFKYVSWQRDSEVVMEANDAYWAGAPEISELVFRAIPDTSNLVAALRAGEIDIATNISPDVAKQIENESGINVVVEEGIRTFFISLDAENSDSPLAHKEVRQALNYAIDVDLLIDSVLDGYANKVATLIPEQNFGFDPAIEPYEYDLDKAKKLLADAGYPDGFTIELDANNLDSDIVQVLATQLGEVGVEVNINLMDGQTFISNIQAEKAAPMYFQGNTGWTLDAMSNFQSYVKSDRRYNRWENDKADELVDVEEQTIDPEIRQTAFTEAQELLKEEAPFIFLYQIENLYGMSDQVSWKPNSIGVLKMYNASK